MKRLTILLFAILPFILFNCNGSKKAAVTTQSGLFVTSKTLTAVLEEAQTKGKIVFVDMYTTWCTPCKVMDQEVYSHPSVVKFLKDNMISYKVDAEKGNGPDLAIIYNVQVYPTLLFLDDKGREIVRNDGALSITGFLELAGRAVDQ
ncbi:MAG: thiol:disulfide interchange protein [Saprospiraceae bacterium]|jgi:thiol:disulfide interchange protein